MADADQETTQRESLYFFGPFRLSPQRRLLLENGEPVRLGSRALEILIVLLERHGELVTKQDLTARVWPSTVVVEGNLTAQLTALRRALRDGQHGHRYILNDPGRGYRFVAPVSIADETTLPVPVATEAVAPPSLMRVAELCYGCMDAVPRAAGFPASERVAVDAILQRGIQALEFARTLVANEDFDPRAIQAAANGNRIGGHVLSRLANRWLESDRRRTYATLPLC
jgi:DNA-binding winged helix-turn-helix (wHTH) protein